QVVGEMIAGVFMGPSLFGFFFHDLQQQLFPPESLKVLYVGAQLGVGLYMFLVGVEFNTATFLSRARSAASVSIAGMITPFVLGAGLAILLIKVAGLFSARASLLEAMLFLGAAMSITAFPMLARIIFERGLTGTSLGTLALAAGSINDAVAWCVLAILLAIFKQNSTIALLAIGGGGVYAIIIVLFVRPALRFLGPSSEKHNHIVSPVFAFVLVLLMICAWLTDIIGIYSIFGAFLLGTAMPRGAFARHLQKTLEPIVTNFL